MWFLLYNVLLVIVSPMILLILLSKRRCRRGLMQRFGVWPGRSAAGGSGWRDRGRPVLWVHAVSLGEVIAVVPLIRELHKRCPGHRVVVSTVTETGREVVDQQLGGLAEHCYAPFDFPWVVNRAVGRLRPKAFFLVETELWPNLLNVLGRQRIPIVLINGRFSTRSFYGYGLIRSFWRQVLARFTWCLMQSQRDVERAVALGAPPERVVRTGNLKFGQPLIGGEVETAGLSREAIRLEPDEELMVAGSTHAGEEERVLDCYKRLYRKVPALVLMMAPRHIERSDEVEAMVRSAGLAVIRRSQLGARQQVSFPPPRPRVIILDTRGELAKAYDLAVLAFVGGTLVPVGGHNLLEPAFCGKPVFFGPYTDHCEEIATLLVRAGGGVQVGDGEELVAEIADRLRNRESLHAMGQAARQAVYENQGALVRTLDIIEKVLKGNDERGTMNDECRVADMKNLNRPSLITLQRSSFRIHHSARFRRVLRVLISPYALFIKTRAFLYARGWLRRRTLPRPVVSVGNLTVGGTGKTPVVIMLAGWLLAKGKRVAVLSRGYRRESRDAPLLVSDGRSVLAGPPEVGDEPYLIAQRCPGAVVAVGADRHRVGRWVLDRFPIDCFLLDDGFQHLALHRDVNLLLVDASDAKGLDALFPIGRLREPISAVSRATAVLVTRTDGAWAWKKELAWVFAACGSNTTPILVHFTPDKLVDVATGSLEDATCLMGKTGFAFSGIGNPVSFRSLLLEQGLTLLGERIFPDHHLYTSRDVEDVFGLAEDTGAELILTTEKDAAKLAPLCRREARIYAVRLRTEILEGREELEQLVFGKTGCKQVVACA